jgi:murein hydrolase activator
MKLRVGFCIIFLLQLCAHSASASKLEDTQVRLKHLDKNISQLGQTITQEKKHYLRITRELSTTEIRLGDLANSKQTLNKQLQILHKDIQLHQQKAHQLQTQLDEQRSIFFKYLQLRYRIEPLSTLRWLLHSASASAIGQKSTYYQFLLRDQKKNIDQLQSLNQALLTQSELKTKKLAEKQNLIEKLQAQETHIISEKKRQKALLHTMETLLQQKAAKLALYKQNRKDLEGLLFKLQQQPSPPQNKVFNRQRHKLPLPAGNTKTIKTNINQGIMIKASEGSPVRAVFPGKVVFSDWLKGYGLLLILDHGQGYMTLYAHNYSLSRKVGDSVNQLEEVATVGHSGGLRENGLYFEIRFRGKAISVKEWLV